MTDPTQAPEEPLADLRSVLERFVDELPGPEWRAEGEGWKAQVVTYDGRRSIEITGLRHVVALAFAIANSLDFACLDLRYSDPPRVLCR